MRKKRLFLLLAPLLVLCSCGHQDDSLLWKISGNGLQHTSWLFGTHHIIPPGFFHTNKLLRATLDKCDLVVAEIYYMDMLRNINDLTRYQQMGGDSTLRTLMSPQRYHELELRIKRETTLNIEEYSRYRPAILCNHVIAAARQRGAFRMGVNMFHVPMDIYVQTQAIARGAEAVGLESVDFQTWLCAMAIPLERQVDMLECYLGNISYYVNQVASVDRLYREGRAVGLHSFIVGNPDEPCSANTEYYDIFIHSRNRLWMDSLPGYIEAKSCFIAVGALHLGGEEGLIELLRGEGYTVEPVRL